MGRSAAQQEHAMERVRKVYKQLEKAAELGYYCPTNKELGERLHCSAGAIYRAFEFLENANMIDVLDRTGTRRVRIVATGKETSA